jgi:hypothetical protein
LRGGGFTHASENMPPPLQPRDILKKRAVLPWMEHDPSKGAR